MVKRLIRILQPIHFQGSKHAGGVAVFVEPDLAKAVCADVGTALQVCNDLLIEKGLAPLGLVVEGHTSASLQGDAESERISGLRAQQCEKCITEALRATNVGKEIVWGMSVANAVSFKGYGSKVRLPGFDDGGNYAENRRVEMRLVAPGEAGYFVGSTAPSLTSVAIPSRRQVRPKMSKKLQRARTNKHNFHLRSNSSKPIIEQLREQIMERHLRARELFAEMDDDGDGHIDQADWLGWMHSIGPEVPKVELIRAFREADADHNGTIEMSELEAFFKGRIAHASMDSQARDSLPRGRRPKSTTKMKSSRSSQTLSPVKAATKVQAMQRGRSGRLHARQVQQPRTPVRPFGAAQHALNQADQALSQAEQALSQAGSLVPQVVSQAGSALSQTGVRVAGAVLPFPHSRQRENQK